MMDELLERPDYDDLTVYEQRRQEVAAQAKALGLPRVIWESENGVYRLVLILDEEEGVLRRVAERVTGCDAMGVQRYEALGAAHFDEARYDYSVPRDWQFLAQALMEQAAPFPSSAPERPERQEQESGDTA
jgi:hypothetical protein